MKIEDFEKELQKLYKGITIIKNVKREEFATVFIDGMPAGIGMSSQGIFDTIKPDFGIMIGTTFVPHPTKEVVTAKVNKLLNDMQHNKDNFDAQMGIGKYSDTELRIRK